MAMHFTENKSSQSVAGPRTPFSIEDILYQNGNIAKSGMKTTCGNTIHNSNFISNNVNVCSDSAVSGPFAKKTRNENESVNHSKQDEFRKAVPNER